MRAGEEIRPIPLCKAESFIVIPGPPVEPADKKDECNASHAISHNAGLKTSIESVAIVWMRKICIDCRYDAWWYTKEDIDSCEVQ